jgi:hypothetical protein
VFQGLSHVLSLTGYAVAAIALLTAFATPLRAQTAPGGFVVSASDASVRAPITGSATGFLPQRGPFTFPAPYGTQGIRITNAGDCGGADCVDYGYSYWNKINNHAGSDTMLIVVGLNRARGGAGPTLFTFNKTTGETRNAGPLFDTNSSFSYATAEQWYFSGTRPSTIYVGENGPRLLRYDVLARAFETVFDVTSLLGGGKYLWQMHSSHDDRVHSATVKNSSTYQDLGCLVYREDTRQHQFFTPRGDYDECQIDRSGRWLVIKENVDGNFNEDNRVIDIETGAEQILWDQNGAAGHSDMGFGYIVGEDDKWAANPYGVRVWQFGPNMSSGEGRVVYSMPDWNGPGVGHIAHSNSKAGVPLGEQLACGSNAGAFSLSRTNEIVCFRLDGTMQVLVVAPNMTDLNASGGGSDAYSKRPKGNIDPTGEYFLWTSNLGGSRADVFLARIPSHLLGVTSTPTSPTPTSPTPTSPTPTSPTPTSPTTSVTDPVQWMFTANVSATGNSLVKTSGCDGCPDASAVSSGEISGTGVLQFAAPEAGTLRYVGLGYGGAGTAPGDINFAVRLQNGVAEVREGNTYRTEIGFAAGDSFSISVDANVVRYFKNGGIFYTSATPVTSALRLHAVLFNLNAAVNGLGLGGLTTTSTTAPTTTTPTTTTTTTTAPRPRWARPRATGSTPVVR